MLGDGLAVTVLGDEAGAASAFKLSVYGFNKGLVALFLEMRWRPTASDCVMSCFRCLRDFYPGSVETAVRLLPTYPRHAGRRTQEMTEVVEWLGEVGLSANMASATREVIPDVASLELRDGRWDAEKLVAEMCRRGLLRGRRPLSS